MDIRMGKPGGIESRHSEVKEVALEEEPGEVKHLSTPRKRNHERFSK